MQTKRHYIGLTDAQVIESRARHGINVLTPPERDTLWDRFKEALRHPISIILLLLSAASVAFAAWLAGSVGAMAWVMPGIMTVAAMLIIVVGFFGGYKDPLFRILITAFVLSIGISIYEYEWHGADLTTFFEPIGIIVALLLATGVAFFLERSNEKTFRSLNEVNDDTLVKVIRNDNVSQVPRRDIVVGDIVIMETGEEVPADCELLEALNLSVNESSLTGEPVAMKTTQQEHFDKEATYPSNHLMKGTTIVEGYCTATVLKVGDATECGKVFEAAQVREGDATPLSRKLDKLAMLITTASYVIGILIIIGRIMMYFVTGMADFSAAEGWIEFVSYMLSTVMIAVTLIVVAVPEGLPMSVTLSLAFSMRKLMKENTLPRTMHACETMGATSVICTDKTGTLTQNQMRVMELSNVTCTTDELAEATAVNTTAYLDCSDKDHVKPVGNPTEGAMVMWLHEQGYDFMKTREDVPVQERLPFTTENKYMATVVQSPCSGKKMLYVKGAPEIMLAMTACDSDMRTAIETQLKEYQDRALRTLALVKCELPEDRQAFVDGKIADGLLMTFMGLFAIQDPVRGDVPDAIRSCIDAGIQVKIVTGDTLGTAREIGRQIGLWTEHDSDRNILTGTEFAAMTDEELSERIMDLKILSRARPADKERLVRLLKAKDMVVAVTGDGTNDAPALNAANVGLSMGDGTAVAKEASDMTIQDNSFSTISNAIIWGRSLYKNIQRFIMYQMTINVVACLIVLIGAFLGTESPLTVTQMLWVNLIMDTFAAIALASLPPSKAVMAEMPRKATDSIINRGMAWNILGVGGFFTAILLVILLVMQHADITSVTDLALLALSAVGVTLNTAVPATGDTLQTAVPVVGAYDGLSAYELSLFFTIFVMLQFWNMFNAKAFMTGRSSFSRISECRGFLFIAAVIFLGQIMIVELGGQMFNVCHLPLTDWLIIILATLPVLLIGELARALKR